MSEASRARRQFLINRLEELAVRLGPVEEPAPQGVECDPSWGPVGSLAQCLLDPLEYARLVEATEQLNRMERAARYARGETAETILGEPAAVQPSNQTLEPERALRVSEALQKLDQFGETPVYVCELCDEQSAKASVPLDMWHCTACGAWGRPSRVHQRSVLPGTDVQRV